MFDHRHYVPVLKWRQGEYQALLHLTPAVKRAITPLIELTPVDWDFDANAPQKSIDDKLAKFGKRLKEKWGTRRCFIDGDLIEAAAAVDTYGRLVRQRVRMATGTHPLVEAFGQARAERCHAVPVTALDRDADYQAAVQQITSADSAGACLRLPIADFDRPNLRDDISDLLVDLSLSPADVDLVVDAETGPFKPHGAYARNMETTLATLPFRAQWRTLTLIGASFPDRLDSAIYRPAGMVDRDEWLGYGTLIGRLSSGSDRLPAFGDYAVSPPGLVRLDMRLLDPTAKLKYTVPDSWYVGVGQQTKKYGRGQMQGLCNDLIASGHFMGSDHCYGCGYISGCSGGGSTGGSSTWPTVATNHHITFVVGELASFHAASAGVSPPPATP